jgi:hypothetical protein
MLIDLETELKLINPSDIRIYVDELLGLCMEQFSTHTTHTNLKAVLMFPLTDRDQFIHLSDPDKNEIGIIRNIDSLDPQSQAALRQELAKAYFIPTITRIKNMKEEFGISSWTVETDSGERKFEVRDRRDIRYITGTHLIIRDVDGNRFEIPDLTKLDAQSLVILESEI